MVILVEMGVPSNKVDHYNPKTNEDMIKLSLDLLEEKRDTKKGSPDTTIEESRKESSKRET